MNAYLYMYSLCVRVFALVQSLYFLFHDFVLFIFLYSVIHRLKEYLNTVVKKQTEPMVYVSVCLWTFLHACPAQTGGKILRFDTQTEMLISYRFLTFLDAPVSWRRSNVFSVLWGCTVAASIFIKSSRNFCQSCKNHQGDIGNCTWGDPLIFTVSGMM